MGEPMNIRDRINKGMLPKNPAEAAVDREKADKTREAVSGLAKALGGSRTTAYTPIGKSLEAIGLQPKRMFVTVGDEPVDCIVIPVEDLMRLEWLHMGGGIPLDNQEKGTDDATD